MAMILKLASHPSHISERIGQHLLSQLMSKPKSIKYKAACATSSGLLCSLSLE